MFRVKGMMLLISIKFVKFFTQSVRGLCYRDMTTVLPASGNLRAVSTCSKASPAL